MVLDALGLTIELGQQILMMDIGLAWVADSQQGIIAIFVVLDADPHTVAGGGGGDPIKYLIVREVFEDRLAEPIPREQAVPKPA